MITNGETILLPDARIAEADGKLQLYVDLPGVAEKDLELTLERGLLSIRGRGQAHYEREFRLGEELDPDSIQAVLKNGVLKLELGKRDLARRVPVQAG
jgi:HSP20 family molecular chaperone IbpA